MFEQKAPDEVDVAEDLSEYGEQDGKDKVTGIFSVQECGPSDKNLNNPVDNGNEEKDDLDQSGLYVKPRSHEGNLLLKEKHFQALKKRITA